MKLFHVEAFYSITLIILKLGSYELLCLIIIYKYLYKYIYNYR